MSNERFVSVSDALEEMPVQAEDMRSRSSLMMAMTEYTGCEGLTRRQTSEVFGVTPPRVLDLIWGKIEYGGRSNCFASMVW